MGRASTSKKVSRAAGTGGGRTSGGNRPLGWYAAIAAVVMLGFAGIFFSRSERRSELASGNNVTAPLANKDHWHAAYGIYLCGSFAEPITDQRDPYGIHTHGDGIIHIHPFVRSAAGKNATLGKFFDTVQATLTDSSLRLPSGKSYTEGKTKCGGKDGVLQVAVNGKVSTVGLRDIRMKDRDLITVAFAPAGAKLPSPPSASQLNKLEDVAPATKSPTTTVAGAATDTSTTEQPAESTTTAKP